MKYFSAVVVVFFLSLHLPDACAQSQDEQYIHIYNLIQQGDSLNEAGQTAPALEKYQEAQTALRKLQSANPDWNANVVRFRLKYLESKITPLTANPSGTNAPAATSTNELPSVPKSEFTLTRPAPTAKPAPPDETASQLQTLQEEVRQLVADKALLQAKLKEALAIQPAAVDPRELTKAEERIKSLLKENELLKVGLAEEQARSTQLVAPAVLEQNKQALADANRKLTEQTEAAIALRTENDLLKKQVADLRSKPAPADKSAELSRQLAQAQTQMAALQSDKEIARLEKIALENRIKELSTTPAPKSALSPPPTGGDATRVKELERERDELQKKLDVATKELYGRKGASTAARVEEMTTQLEILRARLEVFEARQVPYTQEELALLKPSLALAAENPKAGKKSAKELPKGAGPLLAEAQRAFAAQRYDEAEQKYLQVLQLDEKNVYTLGNLAAIQLELNRLDAAEKNLKQALAIEPDDAFSLSLLGYLRFQQQKYDEALDLLSRSAKLNPQSAETQNYLGITLSQKGMRGPAEAALRKAVQLNPGYGSAHNNLAVIYVSQQPPMVELARWHYQKALAAGMPRSPNLEKMLDEKKSAERKP